MKIWLVECRAESNPHTGACRGPWYPCGYEVHRKKKDAEVEIAHLGGRGPYRAVEYIRKDRPPMIDLRGKPLTKRMLNEAHDAVIMSYLKEPAYLVVSETAGTVTGRISTKTKNISNRPKERR